MTKLMSVIGAGLAGMVLLVIISSRSLSELMGYAKATADTAVNQVEDSVPQAIRDQKLKNDIEQARGEIIDRRVKLNLASTEIRRMRQEIDQLSGAIRRRETILSEAYPALEQAANDRLTEVSFAGTKWLPTELGAEIDKLLMEQDRDERQLAIRREAQERLVKSIEEGTGAIAQMETKLLEASNEFQALAVRREQAQNENELLDLVAAAGRSSKTSGAQIGANLDGLRGDVHRMEARNEARRETVPLGQREESRLSQAYSRLERLKALHEKHQVTPADSRSADSELKKGPDIDSVGRTSALQSPKAVGDANDKKDVIIVIKDSSLEQAPKGE